MIIQIRFVSSTIYVMLQLIDRYNTQPMILGAESHEFKIHIHLVRIAFPLPPIFFIDLMEPII